MKYSVFWKKQAEDQLAEIWMTSQDRAAVSAAADGLGRMLKTDPEQLGESRFGTRRIMFIPPLRVAFRVDEDDRTVWILAIHSN